MGGTYIHLPDDTYLHVPDGTDMVEVRAKLASRFPSPEQSSKMEQINPVDTVSRLTPRPRPTITEEAGKLGAGALRGLYSVSAPGIAAAMLNKHAPGVSDAIGNFASRHLPVEARQTFAPPNLTKESVPNAVMMMAGGDETGSPETAGGGASVERSGPNVRPDVGSSRPTPAAPPRSVLDIASMVPGKVGLVARILKKFGVGREGPVPPVEAPAAPSPVPPVSTTGGIPWGTGGQGPLELRGKVIPKPPTSIRPEPAWRKLQQSSPDEPLTSLEREAQGEGPQKQVVGTPANIASGKLRPMSREESDAAFARAHPVENFQSGMDPVAEATWQQSVHGKPPTEDIGAKVRGSQKGVPRTGKAPAAATVLEKAKTSTGEPNPYKDEPYISQDEWDSGHAIETGVENTPRPQPYQSPSFSTSYRPNYPGSINPRPRRYFPEQDISDEELEQRLGLRKQ